MHRHLERDEADLIQAKGLEAIEGGAQVTEVDGIEGAAEDADHDTVPAAQLPPDAPSQAGDLGSYPAGVRRSATIRLMGCKSLGWAWSVFGTKSSRSR